MAVTFFDVILEVVDVEVDREHFGGLFLHLGLLGLVSILHRRNEVLQFSQVPENGSISYLKLVLLGPVLKTLWIFFTEMEKI